MFKALEGDTAVVQLGGVFKVCQLYERDGKLFAQAAGGFVRLYANGSTSKPNLMIESLQLDEPLFTDRFGRLAVAPGEGRKPVEAAAQTKLLASPK